MSKDEKRLNELYRERYDLIYGDKLKCENGHKRRLELEKEIRKKLDDENGKKTKKI